jgi:hypothetical protein
MATTAVIAAPMAARVVTSTSHKRVRLYAGDTPLELGLEGGNEFQTNDIDLGTIRLERVGQPERLDAAVTSTTLDRDGNGVPEIALVFRKQQVRSLFSGIISQTDVATMVTGRTHSGAPFQAELTLTVIPGRGRVWAVLYPNPLNPGGTLSFTTHAAGPAHVIVFDLRGRLVRTLLDTASAPPGYHEVRIDGRDGTGAKLASGVYFYRIETPGDVTTGRFAVLK